MDEGQKNSFLSSLTGWTDANHGYTGHDAHGPLPGTCRWILSHKTFKDWLHRPESGLLFITGNAGCGKSFLAKFLRDHLPSVNDGEFFVTPYFCNSTKNDKNEPPILHFFIHQLISHKSIFFEHVGSKYRDRDKSSPSLLTAALFDILQNILKDPEAGKIVLLIDGLDECDSQYSRELLRQFDWMLKEEGPEGVRARNHLRFVITCREEKGIEHWCPAHNHIQVTPEEAESDISIYVQSEIERISHSKVFTECSPSSVASLIKTSASGVFLWVRNIIREIENLEITNLDAVRQTIWRCPRDMKVYYKRT